MSLFAESDLLLQKEKRRASNGPVVATPGRRLLASTDQHYMAPEAVSPTPRRHDLPPSVAGEDPIVANARQLLQQTEPDPSRQLLAIRRVLEQAELAQPKLAIQLLHLLVPFGTDYPGLANAITNRLARLEPTTNGPALVAPATPVAAHDAVQSTAQIGQAPQAKPVTPPTWPVLLAAIDDAVHRGDWLDVARRLCGFSTDDITWYATTKLTVDQVIQVQSAAPAAMPGYSQRVTDPLAQVIAYQRALAKAHESGDWTRLAHLLDQLSASDLTRRLGSMTWFDYEGIRSSGASERVLAAVDKADAERVRRAQLAYRTAIATKDFDRAVAQLHGMSLESMDEALEALAADSKTKPYLRYLKAAALHVMPAYATRVTGEIDKVWASHDDQPIVLITPSSIVEIPDLSADTRMLVDVALADFAGIPKIHAFCVELANVYGARRAGVAANRKKNEDTRAAPDTAADKLAELHAGWEATGAFYAHNNPKMKFATFAKAWMSEAREKGERFSEPSLPYANPAKTDPSELTADKLEPLANNWPSFGQQVHPFVNQVIRNLAAPFTASTYLGHGNSSKKVNDWAPLCLDVTPLIRTDERGLYEREQMMDFLHAIDAAVGSGKWSGIYNDTALVRHAQANGFSGRIASTAEEGARNFHGALNLHIHLYLKPPDGSGPDLASAPKLNPEAEPH